LILHRLRVSLNDEYGFAELCARRLDLILEPLGLKPATNWRRSADGGKGVVMQYYAESLEREYASPIPPEVLKLILKGTEYAVLPAEFETKIQQDLEIDGLKYVKLCDADVWFPVGRFITATWDKVTSMTLGKKRGSLGEKELMAAAMKKLREVEALAPPEKVEEIRKMEMAILRARVR